MMRGIKKIYVIGVFVTLLTLSIIMFPDYTLAQSSRDYGTTKTSSLQRMLDAWDKGAFCASCHKLSYPLPPEESFNAPNLTRIPGACRGLECP